MSMLYSPGSQLTMTTDIEAQKEVLLQAAVHVKRHRGTSVDLLRLVEMLGLEDALDEHLQNR